MKNKKNMVIVAMCIAFFAMSIGYAAFSTLLTINGTASIESNWQIEFTKIEKVAANSTRGATETKTPSAKGTSATFNVDLQSPGDKIEYIITVENKGTLDAIIEDITASETGSDAILFKIENIKIGDILEDKQSTTFNVIIEYDSSITSQPNITTNELTINIDYIQKLGNQTINPSNPSIVKPLSTAILNDNFELSDEGIDFSKTSEETSTNGLYYTNKNTENNQTTYYFRGNVENNYVKFGQEEKEDACVYNNEPVIYLVDQLTLEITDKPTKTQCEETYICDAGTMLIEEYGLDYRYVAVDDQSICAAINSILLAEKATYGVTLDMYWRIVRINEDGSVRLIYSGTSVDATGVDTTIGKSQFNKNYDDNAYVGYMYGATGQSGDDAYKLTHANDNPSIIKETIDNWYTNNTNLPSLRTTHLADAGFCNDRSVAPTANTWYEEDTALGYAKNATYYGVYSRLINNPTDPSVKENAQPQFACPNADDDLFTTSESSKGNNALSNPIGLITLDEVAYAGGVYNEPNNSYYLSTGVLCMTMSPAYFDGSDAYILSVSGGRWNWNGSLGDSVVDGEYGVRPVVNLQSGVEIVSGDGTKDTPYVIK